MRSEVTAGQSCDLKAEFPQSFLSEVDLPVFKWIFVAAAHQERELSVVSLEEPTEIEPVALRFVIGHEAGCSSKVEQSIVPVHGAMEFAKLCVGNVIAFGPHLPYSWRPLEQREGLANALPGPVGEAAQHRRGVPRMGVPVREEPAIENEYPAYLRAASGFAPLRALKPTLQMLQDDKRGKVEGDQRGRADTKIAPDRFYQIGALRGRIRIFLGLVAVTHADVLDEDLWHLGRVRQIAKNPGPSK